MEARKWIFYAMASGLLVSACSTGDVTPIYPPEKKAGEQKVLESQAQPGPVSDSTGEGHVEAALAEAKEKMQNNQSTQTGIVETEAPVKPLVPAFPQKRNMGVPVKLDIVFFGFDSSTLTPKGRAILIKVAAWLQKNPSMKLNVEGHSDERGSTEYNLSLGWRRSHIVQNFLLAEGVFSQSLNAVSYGEEVPLSFQKNETAWQKNRRVQFSLTRTHAISQR